MRFKYTKQSIHEICSAESIKSFEIIGDVIHSKTQIQLVCSCCGKTSKRSIYALKGMLSQSLSWCKHCNLERSYITSKLVSESDAIKRINSVDSMYKFVRWENDKYNSYTHSKAIIRCTTCSNNWSTNLNNFVIKHKGCPFCSKKGYQCSRPGYIYVYLIKIDDVTFLKFGITNDLKIRSYQQAKLSNCTHDLVFSKLCEDGSEARKIESSIISKFKGFTKFASKDIFPDGYTETLSVDKLNELISFIEEIV